MPTMKFRTGLIVGLGVGYVLGARAGRERYEQITDAVGKVTENEQVSAIVEQAAQATEIPRIRVRGAMSNGLRSASESIRTRSAPQKNSS
jgi:hypothetical protein